eukprot:scaffold5917_cov103-Cylindrotheca_fusiformis.AAC.1
MEPTDVTGCFIPPGGSIVSLSTLFYCHDYDHPFQACSLPFQRNMQHKRNPRNSGQCSSWASLASSLPTMQGAVYRWNKNAPRPVPWNRRVWW